MLVIPHDEYEKCYLLPVARPAYLIEPAFATTQWKRSFPTRPVTATLPRLEHFQNLYSSIQARRASFDVALFFYPGEAVSFSCRSVSPRLTRRLCRRFSESRRDTASAPVKAFEQRGGSPRQGIVTAL